MIAVLYDTIMLVIIYQYLNLIYLTVFNDVKT